MVLMLHPFPPRFVRVKRVTGVLLFKFIQKSVVFCVWFAFDTQSDVIFRSVLIKFTDLYRWFLGFYGELDKYKGVYNVTTNHISHFYVTLAENIFVVIKWWWLNVNHPFNEMPHKSIVYQKKWYPIFVFVVTGDVDSSVLLKKFHCITRITVM